MPPNAQGIGRKVRGTLSRRRPRRTHAAWAAAILLISGCAGDRAERVAAVPRAEDMSWGPVEVLVTADPPAVELGKDLVLTVRITAPSEMQVAMPVLEDRVEGFSVGGVFDRDPVVRDGKTTLERRARLTPVLAEEYRVAPMPIEVVDAGRSPAEQSWFPTRPIVFDLVPPVEGDPGKEIGVAMDPVWVRPSAKTLAAALLSTAVLAGLGVLLWKILRRAHRQIQLMRLSPRERAMKELTMLLARDLIGKALVKQFYLELTMIVRRYVERAHGIRAPEQTTEEFLEAASRDHRFGPHVLARLRAFLEAADLVKFAAHRPDRQAVDDAFRTAKDYVESDAAQAEPEERKGEG